MSLEAAFVLCRWLHDGAALLLFGGSAVVWGLAPRRLGPQLDHAAWRWADLLGPVLAVTGLVWLLLEAGSMGEGWADAVDPATLREVLLDTSFGVAWQAHLLLLVLLLVALALRQGGAVVAAAALLLASLGLVGHAAMQDGLAGWGHRANLAAHLLSAGFWVGGLVPLLSIMALAGGATALRGDAITTLHRFSAIGQGAVALVIATGAINTRLIFGRWPTALSSPYVVLLAVKVALVAGMTALALLNRFVLVPRLARSRRAASAIGMTTTAEIGIGVIVVGLVSLFGLLEPG